jgi:head-tail adaptor
MQTGKLREEIVIQKKVKAPSDSGDIKPDYVDFARVFADVRTKSSGDVTHTVYIRWLSGMLSDMRILWNNKILYINPDIGEDMRHGLMMTLNCKEDKNGHA